MARRKPRQRGPRGEGYVSYDKRRKRWRATIPLPGSSSRTAYFATADEAEAWKAAQLDAQRRGTDLAAGRQKLSAALSELVAARARYASEGTIATLRHRIKLALAELGDPAVDSITARDIERMDQGLRQDYATETCDQVLIALSSLYKRLMALQVVTFNPVDAYRVITPARARGGLPARAPVVLDPAQCRAVLQALEGEHLYPFVLWLMALPFRVSELRGLRQANVQFDMVTVVEQRTHRAVWTPRKPKTEDGTRDLPLAAQLRAAVPTRASDLDLVFPNQAGGPVFDATLRHTLDRALASEVCQRYHVPRFVVHDLRHTAASNILRLGCPDHYVQWLLGHAPTTITRHYAKPDVPTLRPWCEQWCDLLLSVRRVAQTGT